MWSCSKARQIMVLKGSAVSKLPGVKDTNTETY